MTRKIIIGLLAVYMTASGCKKDLDLRPTDTVTEEVAFNSIPALQKGLNTTYARYGVARTYTMYATSLTSDEVKFGPGNGGSGQFGYRLQYNSDNTSGSDVTNMWSTYYQMIDMANRVLAKINDVPATGADLAQRDYIKAQLLALRAMGHFELLQGYAKKYDAADPLGIPVVLTSCVSCEPKRNTVAEVTAQVEKDLNDAKALMPAVTAASFSDLALNQISVTAYQARVALYKGEWQKASDLTTVVINSGIKPLVSGTAFSGIWNDISNNEILFRSRFENSSFVGSQWNLAGILFSPSDKLTATYSASDIRSTAYIGTTGGSRYVKKFSSSSRGANVVDMKGIRTAEMYLIRAEARAELNDLTGAAADINALRSKRIAPYTNISYADKATAINDIMLERYRELAFEGFRFYDLKRRGLDVQRNASDVDSPLWQTLPASNYRFVYPIPSDEILANRNMVQNPGY
jgi:hypothetical protein